MGIRAINIAYGASYGAYNQKLTAETRKQLEILGIPFNSNTTEQEGKMLIKAYKSQNEQNAGKENLFQGHTNTDSLYEKAKKLAEKLGIQVPENADFKQLLNAIEIKLNQKLSTKTNDIDAIKELKTLSQELAFIQAQSNGSSGYDATNQALMSSLEMLSEYNKNFLKH